MFAFAELKLINPNTNISLLSTKASAQIFDNMLQPCSLYSVFA